MDFLRLFASAEVVAVRAKGAAEERAKPVVDLCRRNLSLIPLEAYLLLGRSVRRLKFSRNSIVQVLSPPYCQALEHRVVQEDALRVIVLMRWRHVLECCCNCRLERALLRDLVVYLGCLTACVVQMPEYSSEYSYQSTDRRVLCRCHISWNGGRR